MCQLTNCFQQLNIHQDINLYLVPMLVSLILGATIGLEREIHRKPAGLRTNMLICLGASLFTLISKHFGVNPDSETRIIQGVVTGVGFLGAGVLIHQQGNVHGLTTAATIWLVTAIGIACGARLYGLGVAATILAVAVLMGLNPIERKLGKKKDEKSQILPHCDESNKLQ